MTESVTVLIPAHNEEEFIADAVSSSFRQTAPPERVLVVADSCTDRTAEIARSHGADVLVVSFKSKADTLNHALRQVTTSHVALLDADGYFATDDVLEICLTSMRDNKYGGVCTSVTPHSVQGLFQRSRAIEWAATHRISRRVESWHGWVAVLSGMAGVYRTDILQEIGGWSNDGLCEDVELALKMNHAGYRAGFVSEVHVCVRDPGTWGVYWKQTHRWAAGWAQAIYKYKGLFFRSWGFTKVFGTMLIDSFLLATGYITLIYHLATGFAQFSTVGWLGWWFLGMSAMTVVSAGLQIGVRRALGCYPAFLVVGTLGSLLSLWVMVREWVLGKHLISWTGRHGRRAVITRMSAKRRLVLATLGIAGGAMTNVVGSVLGTASVATAGAWAMLGTIVLTLPACLAGLVDGRTGQHRPGKQRAHMLV